MRLEFALPAAAGGLVIGWAAIAAAATATAPPPPAAPIFYCPAKSAPAGKPPACAPATSTPAALHRRVRHRHEVRIAQRRAVDWRKADLSEGQRFIHEYERRHHGFEVEAGPPPCPDAHGYPPPREWAEAPPRVIVERAPPQPPQVIVERAPPPPQQVIIEREAPPPPKIIIEHPPAPPPQVVFERAPAPPPRVIYERAPPPCPERCAPPPREYGWQDRHEGDGWQDRREEHAGVVVERREREESGGWRYAERNGRGFYQTWGEGRRGRPCPPQVPEGRCSGDAGFAQSAYESGDWGDSGYGGYGEAQPYAGRDAYGYLVWPGKTEQ